MKILKTFWTKIVVGAHFYRDNPNKAVVIKVEDFIQVITKEDICNNSAGHGDGCVYNHDPIA